MAFKLKAVFIQFKPKSLMRIPGQIGDWYERDNIIYITVASEMDAKSAYAVAVHELFEKLKCDEDGVTEKQVDKWDTDHQDSDEECGDMKGCPYGKQHKLATKLEKLWLKVAGGMSWKVVDS